LVDPIVAPHIPETMEFNAENLRIMLSEFPVVYLKPDKGQLGLGIIRTKKLYKERYEISSGNSH